VATSVFDRRSAWQLWVHSWPSEVTQQAGRAVFVCASMISVCGFQSVRLANEPLCTLEFHGICSRKLLFYL
jgi:hypothetical protein